MREHKNMEPKEKETPALQEMRPVFGKGHYVDVYV
jgi:hypothetical protein